MKLHPFNRRVQIASLVIAAGCTSLFGGASQSTTPAAQTAQSLNPAVSNHVVYHNAKEFAGWPANEGMWAWGDELLVGFEVADFVETDGDHNIDRNSPKRIVFARSLDGGKTWSAEHKAEIGSPEYIGDRSLYDQSEGDRRPVASPGGFDFSQPDFAMKVRGNTFHISNDRGQTWSRPYLMPEFGYDGEARTSYIITGPSSATFFITGRIEREGIRYARSGVVTTDDGGKTFEFAGWIGDDVFEEIPADKIDDYRRPSHVFSIMPSAVMIGENHYVCAVRQRVGRRKWTDIFETTDGGKSWEKVSVLERGSSNPATLVTLEDGRIAAVYGSRRRPLGVAGKVSADNGKTWSEEVMLREDAREWDLGYSRAVVRPDGKVVATYYYTTEAMPENFIAASIWDVDATQE